MEYKYLFGPVPSRRLGMSLGIDLVTLKTCSYNCVYCEVGKTNNLTIDRNEYIPTETIMGELDDYLKTNPKLDYITFSGYGEPTLHKDLGKIIDHINLHYSDYKTALITNSSLFGDEKLRKSLLSLDVILPSLDAVTRTTFLKINRPHPHLKLDNIINGLIKFRKEFKNKIWLEIFLIPGMNDTKEELIEFKRIIKKINPDQIQLNTLDRPGTEDWVKPLSHTKMKEIIEFLKPLPVIDISKPTSNSYKAAIKSDVKSTILSMISRRPCTLDDMEKVLGIHRNEINKYLRVLENEDKIEVKSLARGNFYSTKK